jgi:ankyrin repeat protein
MEPNKIIQLFLALFLIISASLKAQDASPKQYSDPDLRFALPADCKVRMNWISAPIEDSVVKKRSIYNLCFGVDLYNQPWIGFHNEDVLNPVKQYQFTVSPRYENFTILENGALLFATDNDLGYVAPPNYKTKDYNNRIKAFFQPISALPISNCKIYPGAGNALFLSGKNGASGQYEVYLLAPEKTTTGSSIKQYKKIFSGPEDFVGIAGDSSTFYIATYKVILKINTKDNKVSKIPLNTMDRNIRGLAYNTQSGLYYCTDKGVGFLGTNTNIPFLSCVEPKIYIRGGTLYVLCSKTLGVLSFDNIGDLKRYDRPIETVPATNNPDAKVSIIHFFEGPSPAQTFKDRKYTATFGKDTTRYIYAEIYLENLLVQKQLNKQMVSMSIQYPFGRFGGSQKMLFNYDLNTPTLVYSFQYGNGILGSFYPGEYILNTYLNDIKVDERSFTVTGKPTIIEAAAQNDTVKLRELIRNGADVNYKNEYGTTALMQVTAMGDLETTKMLIDRGADVNARNSTGQSPLITACLCYGNNTPIVKLLLAHNADVNAANKDGETPLITELIKLSSSAETAKMLIDAGANVNAKDAKGQTPLMCINRWISNPASAQIIEMLLKKGNDPNANQLDGTPMIFAAAERSDCNSLELLLNYGANPNAIRKFGNTGTRSILNALLENYTYSADPDKKQRILKSIDFLCEKGGRLTNDEEKSNFYGSYWKGLPNNVICEMLERQDETVKYYDTQDTTIQKVIIKRLITLAFNDIVKATSTSDYHNALSLCKTAKEYADKHNLISGIPEIYFDLGLLSLNCGYEEDAGRYLKNYMEVAPDGPLASKAKSMLRKID